MNLRYFSSLILLGFVLQAGAQGYAFESKKAEKLYWKLEGFYEEMDYASILKSETDIRELFLNKQDTLAALMYSFLGEAYLYELNEPQKSLEFYQKDYEIRKALGTEGGELSEIIFNLGYLQDQLGYYNKTESLYLELLDLESAKYGKRSDEYFQSAAALLDHYSQTQEYEKGLKLADELRKVVKKDTDQEAHVLHYTGILLQLSGAYKKSEKHILDALDMLRTAGMYPSAEYAIFMSSLAILYQEWGKLTLAEEVYLDALSMVDRLQGDWSEVSAGFKVSLGYLYTMLGNYTRAEGLFQEALKFDQEYYGENSLNYATNIYNMGLNYLYAGRYRDAETQLTKSVTIIAEVLGENSMAYLKGIRQLSAVYTKTRELDKALELAQKAATLSPQVTKDEYQWALDNYNLGEIYLTKGDLVNGKKYHQLALDQFKKSVGDTHPKYARSTNKLAILSWKADNLKDTKAFYQMTFDRYFQQINTVFPVLSEEEKSKFYYNNLRPAFEQYNSFIVNKSSEDKALIAQMYNHQLATKGLILYATNKVRQSILSSGDSVLIGKYETWIEQKEQLAKLFSAADMPVEMRNKKIDSLNTMANNLERDLSRSSSVFAETFANRDMTWEDVKAKLKPGEAAVEIIRFRDFVPDSAGVFTDEVYYAALIVTSATTEAPEMVLMRNGKLMETRYLSNYRNAIKYRIDEDYSYTLFWRPIANKLKGVKKVYFSPDGVFNQISIYTLRNPATGRFTLDEMEIQVVTNTKDLVAFNGPGNSGNNPSYLFGYPNYNMGNVEQKGGNTQQSESSGDNRSVRGNERGIRGNDSDELEAMSQAGSIPRGLRGNMLRYMRSNSLLALLPGTKKEVELIEDLYEKKQLPSITYLSNDALEDSVKMVKNPRTLHIATHGFFLESQAGKHADADAYVENPLLRSGLILAGANSFISTGAISEEQIHQEDGILTAYEAMNLNLDNTELVILSACETGLGEVQNGEGVYGLQRAFQVAGADAIIMSMWTVDDDATQELMTIFYEEWLSGKSKHDAFIAAQKRLKDKWKSPYFWGAFVMIGM